MPNGLGGSVVPKGWVSPRFNAIQRDSTRKSEIADLMKMGRHQFTRPQGRSDESMRSEKGTWLKRHPVTRQLDDAAIQSISAACEVVELGQGKMAHRAEDRVTSVYLIVKVTFSFT